MLNSYAFFQADRFELLIKAALTQAMFSGILTVLAGPGGLVSFAPMLTLCFGLEHIHSYQH